MVLRPGLPRHPGSHKGEDFLGLAAVFPEIAPVAGKGAGSAAAPANEHIGAGLTGGQEIRSAGAPLRLCEPHQETPRLQVGEAHGSALRSHHIPARIELAEGVDDQHPTLRAAVCRGGLGQRFLGKNLPECPLRQAVLALQPDGFHGCEAVFPQLINDVLLGDVIFGMAVIAGGLEVIGKYCTLLLLVYEAPLPQVFDKRPHAGDIFASHVHPQADGYAPLQGKLHIAQYAVIGGQALLMDAPTVIDLPHAVHRHLKLLAAVLLQKIQIGFKVVAIGDGVQGEAELLGVPGNFPQDIDVFGQERLAAVEGTAPKGVPPGFVILYGGKYRLDHLVAHGA